MNLIVLQSADLRMQIRPDVGGCIEGLWWKGLAVLRSSTAGSLQNVRLSACYPLIPFSNRVAHAKLVWNGTDHPLVKNFAGEEHSIHGIGWQRAWEVLEQSDDFCMLSLEHTGGAAWPFAFDASQTFRLHDNALEMTMSITNQSSQAAPVGLGWHPYFVKRAASRIAFEASGIWQMSAEKLPTDLHPSTGLKQDCASLDVDNCFEGWSGEVALHDEAMQIQISSDMRRLVVFTNADKDFVAIEPVSHANNAMNAGNPKESETRGVVTLEPGQSWQVSMQIAVSAP
ncbi:aldose 1-epimerase [Variovorax sp. PCZ-1]|uniref:aldose 1-epimerase n=1 Tax=Variovorax sp. PCZ-1 TaxID=2835533 RepID=UPI001BCAC640|nr:aldose 1-epimerase [Variovorax sp. PCZ-1]MBS7809025.1 aldose 1-epimerase [Variovorax sp. PCZ-1]